MEEHLAQSRKFLTILTIFLFFLMLEDHGNYSSVFSADDSQASAPNVKVDSFFKSFNFTTFVPNDVYLQFEGDASVSNKTIQLPKNQYLSGPCPYSVGRVSFAQPVQLWNANTGSFLDFITEFSFTVQKASTDSSSSYGDGFAFFIASFGSHIPHNSSGGYLGLLNPSNPAGHSPSSLADTDDPIVAVEFDTFSNEWDPSTPHIGINVNSVESVANVAWPSDALFNPSSSSSSSSSSSAVAHVRIGYSCSINRLHVSVTHSDNPNKTYSVSCSIDLSKVLPEMVMIGFSAATGELLETINILSWSFMSSVL